MKKHLETIFDTVRGILLATVMTAMIFGPTAALAADNIATWNVAGVAQTDSNTFTLSSVNIGALALVKAAYLNSDNTPIANTSTLPVGTLVDFVIYIDNTTGLPVSDANISDTLNALFLYQAGTIQVYNTTLSGATAQAIYDDVRTSGTVQTDTNALGDDAGITGVVVSAGRLGTNDTVTLASGNVWAMMFTVQLQ